ncbi:MAG: hypothetical protein V1848_00490 [Candidatus Magasanikbacteria bacterium]
MCKSATDAGSMPPPDVDAGTPQKLCVNQANRLSDVNARFDEFLWFTIEMAYATKPHVQCKLTVSAGNLAPVVYIYPGMQDINGRVSSCAGPEYVLMFNHITGDLNQVTISENGSSPFGLPIGTEILRLHDLKSPMNAGFILYGEPNIDFTSTTYALGGEILTAAFENFDEWWTSTFAYECY